jgi:midasin (ATPase involved in ribosome maturation)
MAGHSSIPNTCHLKFGGDFGKQELLPALWNWFAEIWVLLISDPKYRLMATNFNCLLPKINTLVSGHSTLPE